MNRQKTIGSALLVAGTAIGAGMLALPITTGTAGFVPSVVVFVVSFAYMLLSLFYLLEVTLYCDDPDANIITIAHERLGVPGKIIAGTSFVLLLYSVVAAYLSGGGELITDFFWHLGVTFPFESVGVFVFLGVFGVFLFFGTGCVDYLNRFLMFGLVGAYLLMVALLAPHVSMQHLSASNPKYIWFTIPIITLAFTSHIIVPSLRSYLESDVKSLVRVLLCGSLVPLVLYVFWNFILLGNLPISGAGGLLAISQSVHPVAAMTESLRGSYRVPIITMNVGLFSFFALVTSFLGASLSLFDFLADGLKIKKNKRGKLKLLAFCFVPPLVFSVYYPQGFIIALGYAGVFVSVLYGILPALMVWHARYIEKESAAFRVPGGKLPLMLLPLGALVIMGLQMAAAFHWLPLPSF